MTNSDMNVRNADLSLTHKFPYKWRLSELKEIKKNGRKVFSCFSCGGGSSMGYKLAGFDVIGNVEIDPAINKIYIANNHPVFNFEMDIRNFVDRQDLPKELFDLDILDGSPPCSTFSLAGNREKDWGKEKRFREGQAAQTLDDLFFWYLKAVKRLQPRIFVAENVKGLLAGTAKGYVNAILKEADAAGYETQIFLLNAASMGVPQKRERVFIIGRRKDMGLKKLSLNFAEKPILYGEFADENVKEIKQNTAIYRRWRQRTQKDKSIGDTVKERENGKVSGFTMPYMKKSEVPRTLIAGLRPIRFDKCGYISNADVVKISTFPEDYDFGGVDPVYVCGMSVPPVMMAQIATQIYEQWFEGGTCV